MTLNKNKLATVWDEKYKALMWYGSDAFGHWFLIAKADQAGFWLNDLSNVGVKVNYASFSDKVSGVYTMLKTFTEMDFSQLASHRVKEEDPTPYYRPLLEEI